MIDLSKYFSNTIIILLLYDYPLLSAFLLTITNFGYLTYLVKNIILIIKKIKSKGLFQTVHGLLEIPFQISYRIRYYYVDSYNQYSSYYGCCLYN